MFVYAFLLFFVLTPGILVTLPPRSLVKHSSKMVIAAVHAAIFAIVWTLTHKMVWRASSHMFEGMGPNKLPAAAAKKPEGFAEGAKGKNKQMAKPAKVGAPAKK